MINRIRNFFLNKEGELVRDTGEIRSIDKSYDISNVAINPDYFRELILENTRQAAMAASTRARIPTYSNGNAPDQKIRSVGDIFDYGLYDGEIVLGEATTSDVFTNSVPILAPNPTQLPRDPELTLDSNNTYFHIVASMINNKNSDNINDLTVPELAQLRHYERPTGTDGNPIDPDIIDDIPKLTGRQEIILRNLDGFFPDSLSSRRSDRKLNFHRLIGDFGFQFSLQFPTQVANANDISDANLRLVTWPSDSSDYTPVSNIEVIYDVSFSVQGIPTSIVSKDYIVYIFGQIDFSQVSDSQRQKLFFSNETYHAFIEKNLKLKLVVRDINNTPLIPTDSSHTLLSIIHDRSISTRDDLNPKIYPSDSVEDADTPSTPQDSNMFLFLGHFFIKPTLFQNNSVTNLLYMTILGHNDYKVTLSDAETERTHLYYDNYSYPTARLFFRGTGAVSDGGFSETDKPADPSRDTAAPIFDIRSFNTETFLNNRLNKQLTSSFALRNLGTIPKFSDNPFDNKPNFQKSPFESSLPIGVILPFFPFGVDLNDVVSNEVILKNIFDLDLRSEDDFYKSVDVLIGAQWLVLRDDAGHNAYYKIDDPESPYYRPLLPNAGLVPDIRNKYLIGMNMTDLLPKINDGGSVRDLLFLGANQKTLTLNQMPIHNHSIEKHTHEIPEHDHTVDPHSHDVGFTGEGDPAPTGINHPITTGFRRVLTALNARTSTVSLGTSTHDAHFSEKNEEATVTGVSGLEEQVNFQPSSIAVLYIMKIK